MSSEEKLSVIRKEIDDIDLQIQNLISNRAQCAIEVAKVKSKSDNTVFYRPEREAAVLRKVKDRNTGILPDDEMARIFREIMSACLALEHQLTIAYLGPPGTYTQSAAIKHFGHSANTTPVTTLDDIFRTVDSGAANYGVVPVENSTEGMVNQSMDLFASTPLIICGEVQLRIHHNLLSREDDIKNIKTVYSHQQSLGQCRAWLANNLPGIQCISVQSNAEAAIYAKENSASAAIAGTIAADLYALNILASNIEDESDNTTRFLIIGKQSTLPSGEDKTSLLLSTRNRPGALYNLLEPFRENEVSMTRVESRPSRKGMWDYVFYIDIEGHQDDEKVSLALAQIRKEASMIKILGSYPKSAIE